MRASAGVGIFRFGEEMGLNGQYIASRFIANVPNLQGANYPPSQLSLLSRNVNETGYTPYLWTGRNLPSDQLISVEAGGLVGNTRKKVIPLIRQTQTVMPKEQDAIYCTFGLNSQVSNWALWTIMNIDVQYDFWYFHCDTLFNKEVTPLALPGTLPSGTNGVAYSQSAAAAGGYGALTYAVSAGALPTGLALNASTGLISGTPTAAATYAFTITVMDAGLFTASQAYSVVIA